MTKGNEINTKSKIKLIAFDLAKSTKIVKYLKDYGLENNCYKIILDCDKNIKKVYEKNDFYEKDIQMVYYK